jgi:hypothetical protein
LAQRRFGATKPESTVKPEKETYRELLERRLTLLEALGQGVLAARAACIARDLEALRAATSEQQRLCLQLRALETPLRQWQPRAASSDEYLDPRLRDTLARVAAAQRELRTRNAGQQSLLRRSRRNQQALANLFRRYAPSYAEAAAPCAGTLCEERV